MLTHHHFWNSILPHCGPIWNMLALSGIPIPQEGHWSYWRCVQKFGLKVCLTDWHCSYNNLFHVSNIPTLASRRQQLELCWLFNIISGYSVFPNSPAARRVFPYLSSIGSTNSATLSQIFAHTTLLQNSFFPSAISLWNTLPEDVCKIHSLSSFKRTISNLL